MNKNWLFTISLPISQELSWEAITNLCKAGEKELTLLSEKIKKSGVSNAEYWADELTSLAQDFELRGEDENDDEMGIQDSIEEVNYILNNLYDIGDVKVLYKGEKRKFICIKRDE